MNQQFGFMTLSNYSDNFFFHQLELEFFQISFGSVVDSN